MREYHYVVIANNEKEADECVRAGVFARTAEEHRLRKEWRD